MWRSRERLDLEESLRRALTVGELFLVYQPQVRIDDGRVVGMEALIRWRHPTLGVLGPNRFLPVAEEAGLMEAIDDWVLDAACAQANRWKRRKGALPSIGVNLSGVQFRDGRLPAKIATALDAYGLDGPELEVEVTEGRLIDDIDGAVAVLGAIKRRGVRVALDDFGTGYSSLSYLHRLPIDKLKIDRSFIRDLEDDGKTDSIPRAIIGLGRSLGLTVIAEGVETGGQLAQLRRLRCDGFQGYLFSRPIPPDELEPILAFHAAPADPTPIGDRTRERRFQSAGP